VLLPHDYSCRTGTAPSRTNLDITKAGEDLTARNFATVLRVLVLGTFLLVMGCAADAPDWATLYERKLGQPIRELNEAALNSSSQDSHGNLTRISWATLANGSTVLLGLPAAQNPPQRVVDRTVVLSQPEWQQLCQEAIGQQAHGWSWGTTNDAVSNTFPVYPSTNPLTNGTAGVRIPEANQAYCEFAFLPEGWVLRVIVSKGVVKAIP
jgi:hypothetical protein